jgi:hypothetical protein
MGLPAENLHRTKRPMPSSELLVPYSDITSMLCPNVLVKVNAVLSYLKRIVDVQC